MLNCTFRTVRKMP